MPSMSRQRRLDLSEVQRQELLATRDHDPRPYVRERCAARLENCRRAGSLRRRPARIAEAA